MVAPVDTEPSEPYSLPESPSLVQSVERALGLLEALGERGGQAGVSDLAHQLGLAVPTAHRLLKTLAALGYVRQLPSRRYELGPSLVRLGSRAASGVGRWSMPALRQLAQEVEETANLAVLDGDGVVYVAQVPSRHQMRMFTEVGRRVYAHSTGVGKAILAQLPDDQVVAMVRRTGMPRLTAHTLTTESALLNDLATTRLRGYAIDDGEQEVGVRCFAIPVAGAHTPTAVSVSGPDSRVTLASNSAIVPALTRAGAELRRALGGD